MKNKVLVYILAGSLALTPCLNVVRAAAPVVIETAGYKELSESDKKAIKAVLNTIDKEFIDNLIQNAVTVAMALEDMKQKAATLQNGDLESQLDSTVETLEPLVKVINDTFAALKDLQNKKNGISPKGRKVLVAMIQKCVPQINPTRAQKDPQNEAINFIGTLKTNIQALVQQVK